MNCEQFMEMLDRYSDLSDIEMAELEKHAMDCDNCRAELDFMRSIIGTVQELPPIEPPQDFLETLNARLDKELAEEPKITYFMRHARPYIERYGTIAACIAVGIVIGANGNMLVSRMNDNADGVISSTSTVSENGTTPVADSTVGAIDLEANDASPVSVPEIAPVTTPIITSEEVNNSIIPPVAEGRAPLTVSSANTGTAVKPSGDANTTAAVTPTVAPVPKVDRPVVDEVSATAKPAKPDVVPAVTTVTPVATAEPKKVDEVKPEPIAEDPNAGIMTASLDEPYAEVPTGYSIRMIDEPEGAPEAYAAAEVSEESPADVAADYSIATTSVQDETAYVAPLSSTLMVKAEDEARAKEVIMGFVEATYGNYYMITGDKLYSLTVRLESEGIWYQANITDSGVKVSFKLVTM